MKRLALAGMLAGTFGCSQDQFLAPTESKAKVRASAVASDPPRSRRDPVTPESITEDNVFEKVEELQAELASESRPARR